MPAYDDSNEAEIDATPQECFDALTDFESLPTWQSAVKRATVLERDDQGRGSVVEFEVDAKVKTVRYRIRQVYDDAPNALGSEYVGGDFRDFSGGWRFEELPGGRTRATVDIRIDPGRFVPGPVRKIIADAVMKRALGELKEHLEGARVR